MDYHRRFRLVIVGLLWATGLAAASSAERVNWQQVADPAPSEYMPLTNGEEEVEAEVQVEEQGAAEVACEGCAAGCGECDPGTVMVDRWGHRARRRLQSSHWGYPEEFEQMPFGQRMPFGASVRAYQEFQIQSGWDARQFLYHYDFFNGGTTLNHRGLRRLHDMAMDSTRGGPLSLRIEATPDEPQLAQARRQHVLQRLQDFGLSMQVEIGVPVGFVPRGEEIQYIDGRRVEQIRGRMSGGMGTAGAPSAPLTQPAR